MGAVGIWRLCMLTSLLVPRGQGCAIIGSVVLLIGWHVRNLVEEVFVRRDAWARCYISRMFCHARDAVGVMSNVLRFEPFVATRVCSLAAFSNLHLYTVHCN